MTEYTTVKVPVETVKSIRLIQAHIALHGMEDLPSWLQDVLIGHKKPLGQSNIVSAGMLVLILIERGKTLEKIKRMGRDEIRGLLKEGQYPDLLGSIGT